jgi:hypothetical protein
MLKTHMLTEKNPVKVTLYYTGIAPETGQGMLLP